MRHFVSTLLGGASLFAIGSLQAATLPAHGHFISGQGQIGKAGQSLTVRQSSTTGIINWSSFSVGAKNSVSFNNGSGATLNRVTGGNLSRIAGSLSASGSLYVMNGAGVIVSGTGHVVTGGSFVASSGNIANTAFNPNQPHVRAGNSVIINRGSINAGGNALLNGRGVANTGSISAASVRLSATTGNALNAGSITASGNAHRGAHVVVISQSGTTHITGDITAHGKDGTGTVETSGHRVTIGGDIDAGHGGAWLVDPENLTVDATAAKKIDRALNTGTDVTLKTTKDSASGLGITSAGAGNIVISSSLSWSSAATLSLDAYHSVNIDGDISLSGAGKLAITTGDGGKHGSYSLTNDASVDYGPTNNDGALTINGVAYTLIYDVADLQKINRALRGNYALATSLDASDVKHWTPIGTNGSDTILKNGKGFEGIFEGLGNAISNLSVRLGSNNYAGLFGFSQGAIRDVDLEGGSVSGGYYVGALVGENKGFVLSSRSNVVVTGNASDEDAGGLIGLNSGSISNSFSQGAVSGNAGVGGLVGDNENGEIVNSHASGQVSGSDAVGGLVGTGIEGEINHSHASGKVTGDDSVGGLVGDNEGTITYSYASGKVDEVTVYGGGLVGANYSTISNSYATGDVVHGARYQGGLSGYNSGQINESYSTGAVSGSQYVGGLAGFSSGAIDQSYSIGNVFGSSQFGGLVGDSSGSVKDSYWDTETSGQKHSAGGKGLTTAQFQAALPKGFSGAAWAEDPSINNGLPYLIALASSY